MRTAKGRILPTSSLKLTPRGTRSSARCSLRWHWTRLTRPARIRLSIRRIYYYFDTSSQQDVVLQTGLRSYRFAFTDDWGRQSDPTDRIVGQVSNLPNPAGSWYSGPNVTLNHAPTLSNGSITSPDGTANDATLWTFNVIYKDQDNDPPNLINVYIGELQPDGKTILWDSGHAMTAASSSNTLYSNGVSYYYQTRLADFENLGTGDWSKRYYYSFVANDGALWAIYNAVSSPSAGTVTSQLATTSDGINYQLTPPVTGAVIVGPMLVGQPTPSGIISDAQLVAVATDTAGNTTTQSLVVDDLKSGWQDNPPVINRYSIMTGTAVDASGAGSLNYITPEDPTLIASVEGVYTSVDSARPSDGH